VPNESEIKQFSTQEEESETLRNHITASKQMERTTIAELRSGDDAITKSKTEHRHIEEQLESLSGQSLKENKKSGRRSDNGPPCLPNPIQHLEDDEEPLGKISSDPFLPSNPPKSRGAGMTRTLGAGPLGVNEKQPAADTEAAVENSKWKDDLEAEASAQNPVRREGVLEELGLGATAEKVASTIDDRGISLEAATINNYNPEPREISSAHNIVKNFGTPINMAATGIRINRQEKCCDNKEINRTIATTPPKYKLSAETKVHNLKAQLKQLTSVESRVHSLMAQLDLLANL